jgi:hypothetical protein
LASDAADAEGLRAAADADDDCALGGVADKGCGGRTRMRSTFWRSFGLLSSPGTVCK